MLQPLMIQGTSSNAGKTTIVAGLCRLFARRGYRVAPFKSQNMALNSFVTREGGEIARATAMQARGAMQQPTVHMNPLLLKPKKDDVAELIVHGRSLKDVSAREYFLSDSLQALKLRAIDESIAVLRERYDLIIAEGAGSCAEPNLRELDVVNMGLAHRLDARVYVLTDIDKGGVFADMLGTLAVLRLTEPRDVALLRGFIVNKFRGDRAVLEPGLRFAEQHTGVPIVGVLPLLPDLTLEQEDRVSPRQTSHPEVDVAVIYFPHISNATDFLYLEHEHNVQVRYVKSARELGRPDAIILPGSKSATWDLDYLRRTGLEAAVLALRDEAQIVGVCGGFEMLATVLHDPERRESELGSMKGMGLLDMEVSFEPQKTLVERDYRPTPHNPFAGAGPISGYEIHTGKVTLGPSVLPAYVYDGGFDGALSADGQVLGTFVHDLFKNQRFTRAFVDRLRAKRGLPALTTSLPDVAGRVEASYDQLATMLAQHLDLGI